LLASARAWIKFSLYCTATCVCSTQIPHTRACQLRENLAADNDAMTRATLQKYMKWSISGNNTCLHTAPRPAPLPRSRPRRLPDDATSGPPLPGAAGNGPAARAARGRRRRTRLAPTPTAAVAAPRPARQRIRRGAVG
jgi:hypothetical protein